MCQPKGLFESLDTVQKVICPYCQVEAKKVYGSWIYPHREDLHQKSFYWCELCNAYVGCHPQTDKPLGTLANAELRALRTKTHRQFDKIWITKLVSRSEAYKQLAIFLHIPAHECHIGMFDLQRCEKVLDFVRKFKYRRT